MDTYLPDESGIYSLGGFAYQIKVFVVYMLSLRNGMQASFETIDDVAIRKLLPENIDENEDNFHGLIFEPLGYKAIQVKKTTISKSTSKQVLLNWILLEGSDKNVIEYILFTDSNYGNEDIIFRTTVDELYEEVIATEKGTRATIGKVKKLYKKDKTGFLKMYDQIKVKYRFEQVGDIDKLVDDRCQMPFRKAAVREATYQGRVQELLQHITYEIMENVNHKKAYHISFDEMMACVEDICNRYTDEFRYPVYTEFKKINPIKLSESQIANSREYKQLVACNLPENLIESQLQYGAYYQNVCFGYLESNKASIVRDIEETTYNNFQMSKIALQVEKKDTPFRRLNETQSKTNSHAYSEQVKFGSSIYLTRDEENEQQISWEDGDNAES